MKVALFKKGKGSRGLTLIEMLVVIAIVMIIAAILLFKYADFSTNVSIRGLAQQMALSIRKGQTYATSARPAETGNFNTGIYPAYGLAFNLQDEKSSGAAAKLLPSDKRFVLFADIPTSAHPQGDKIYQNSNTLCGKPAAGNECVESFTITSGDSIQEICSDAISGNGCETSGSATIIFRRPIPDAYICINSSTCSKSAAYVDIVVESAKGLKKTISVWNTGQISVK
jgi:prepilin-type N-terminal cleavage/methylation domain-containing protein